MKKIAGYLRATTVLLILSAIILTACGQEADDAYMYEEFGNGYTPAKVDDVNVNEHDNEIESAVPSRRSIEEMLEKSLEYGMTHTEYFSLFMPVYAFYDGVDYATEVINLFLDRFCTPVSFFEGATEGWPWIFIANKDIANLRYVTIDHCADGYVNSFFAVETLFEYDFIAKDIPFVVSGADSRFSFPTRGISFLDSEGEYRLVGVAHQFSGYSPEAFIMELLIYNGSS